MSRALDVSLFEEARAYESNRSFAEGAPPPAPAARGPATAPPGPLLDSYRSFRSSIRLMSSVYAALLKILRCRVFYLKIR